MAQKEYFPSIGKIKFEGKESKNPLAYRYYDAEKVIMGKKMKDWLKFAMAWWHTLCAEGGDQFGGGTKTFPWNQGADALTVAKQKADAGFEIMEKLGIEYFCFHDVDLISEGNSIEEYEANMKAIVAYIKEKMQATGIKNLWGTANVFGHERYMNGAATNPDFNVVARAAVQIKNAIDATIELGGSNYVFWGGREGYMSLLNTDMKRQRLQRHVPHRAETDGTDQAPVRCGHGNGYRFLACTRLGEGLQGEHRGEPCHIGRAHVRTRTGLRRRRRHVGFH